MRTENCFHCNKEIWILESCYLVRKATKPNGRPFRWETFAHACERCAIHHNKKLSYEYNESIPTEKL